MYYFTQLDYEQTPETGVQILLRVYLLYLVSVVTNHNLNIQTLNVWLSTARVGSRKGGLATDLLKGLVVRALFERGQLPFAHD